MRTKDDSAMTVKGQITVPKAVRDAMGWRPGTRVRFKLSKGHVKILPYGEGEDPGLALVRKLRGSATTPMTTDEIMRLTRGED
jgi:AbrB family looped-hinge helix DNA binding protein